MAAGSLTVHIQAHPAGGDHDVRQVLKWSGISSHYVLVRVPEYCRPTIREATYAVIPLPPRSEAAVQRHGPLATGKQYQAVWIYEKCIQTMRICLERKWYCTKTTLNDNPTDTY